MNYLVFAMLSLFSMDIENTPYPDTFNHCTIEIDGPSYACEGEEVTLTASPGFEKYYWSNGDTGQVVTVIAPFSGARVVAISEEECVASQRHSVKKYRTGTHWVFGGFKYSDSLWTDIYYYPEYYNPNLTYIWTLNGDTISSDSIFRLDSLDIGEYNLQLKVITPCGTSSIGGTGISSMTILLDQNRVLCTPELPYSFWGIPIFSPGTYRISTRDIFENPVIRFYNFEFSETYEEVYDTTSFCPRYPIYWGGQEITEPGSYESIFISNPDNGCHELRHLEVINPPPSLSATIIDTCIIGGAIEITGEYYEESGIYTRVYPNEEECDSINYLILKIEEQAVYDLDEAICPGDTFFVNEMAFTSPVDNYQVAIPIENACDSIISLTLNWLDQPEKTEAYTICPGDTLEINGEIYFEDFSGTYIIPSLDNGCDTLVHFSIDENPPIELSTSEITPDLGQGEGSISIGVVGGSPPLSYLWNTGETGKTIHNLEAGTYDVIVTDSKDCTATFTFEVALINHTNSFNNIPLKLELYPNPVSQILHVKWNINQEVAIKIIAPTGQQVFSQITKQDSLEISVSHLSPGTYFLSIQSNKEHQLQKFTVLENKS